MILIATADVHQPLLALLEELKSKATALSKADISKAVSTLQAMLFDEASVLKPLGAGERQTFQQCLTLVDEIIGKMPSGAEDPTALSEIGFLRGGMGYYLFVRLAETLHLQKLDVVESRREHAGRIELDPMRAELDSVLAREDTKAFIARSYDLDVKHAAGGLKYHRRGTTSYILKVFSDGTVEPTALKLLKFPYFHNIRILQANRTYKAQYDEGYAYAPRIVEASEKYILMQFVDGPTLREHVDAAVAHKIEEQDGVLSVTAVRGSFWIALQICDALALLASSPAGPRFHLDLSPDNILLVKDSHEFGAALLERFRKVFPGETPPSIKVMLIDFGVNYLIADRVGTSREFARVGTYVDPSVLEESIGDHTSDAYSLALIVLYLVLQEEASATQIPIRLDELWSRFPDLAEFVEDLVATKPPIRRRFLPPAAETARMYDEFSERIGAIYSLHAYVYSSEADTALFSWLRRGFSPLMFFLQFVYQSLRRAVILRRVGRVGDARVSLKLLAYSIICNLCNLALITCCILLFSQSGLLSWLGSFGIGPSPKLYVSLKEGTLAWLDSMGFAGLRQFSANTFQEGVPALIAVLTSSLIAWRYYTNIYQAIYAGRAGPEGGRAEWWMRFNAHSFFLPCLIVILPYQNFWPFSLAYGLAAVAGQNLACHVLARKSLELQTEVFDDAFITNQKDFVEMFAAWWWGMFLYASFALLGGIGLLMGWLKDELAYALVCGLGVNLGVIYLQKAGRQGRWVRSGFSRAVNRLERIRTRMQSPSIG